MRNKALNLLACLLFLAGTPTPTIADDVRLLCEGSVTVAAVTGGDFSPIAYVTSTVMQHVRFNEDSNEFWIKEPTYLIQPYRAVEGWVPARKVIFLEGEIWSKFKRSQALSNLEISLDRHTGILTIEDVGIQSSNIVCTPFDDAERKF